MISDFPVKKNYNPGGYLSFLFAPVQGVASYPIISRSRSVVPVGFAAGYAWLNGYATIETLSYDEESVFDDGGIYYNLSISGFVPGDKPDLIDLMAQMDRTRFISLIKDTTGVQRLVGSPAMPLDFSAVFGSGTLRTDQKGFNFKFTGSSNFRSPVYEV